MRILCVAALLVSAALVSCTKRNVNEAHRIVVNSTSSEVRFDVYTEPGFDSPELSYTIASHDTLRLVGECEIGESSGCDIAWEHYAFATHLVFDDTLGWFQEFDDTGLFTRYIGADPQPRRNGYVGSLSNGVLEYIYVISDDEDKVNAEPL